MKWDNSLQKKTAKALNTPQELLYVCISTLIHVINLFCFVLIIVLYFIYATNLDVSLDFVSGYIEILGKQNRCFPRVQSLNVSCFHLQIRIHVMTLESYLLIFLRPIFVIRQIISPHLDYFSPSSLNRREWSRSLQCGKNMSVRRRVGLLVNEKRKFFLCVRVIIEPQNDS